MRTIQLLKNLKHVRELLGELERSGALDAEHATAVHSAVQELEHAVKVRDQRKMEKAVNQLCILLLKTGH